MVEEVNLIYAQEHNDKHHAFLFGTMAILFKRFKQQPLTNSTLCWRAYVFGNASSNRRIANDVKVAGSRRTTEQ